jgi:hypothetical protein
MFAIFPMTLHLGETHCCISFLGTPVPNFRNRKRNYNIPAVVSPRGTFYILIIFSYDSSFRKNRVGRTYRLLVIIYITLSLLVISKYSSPNVIRMITTRRVR